MRIGRGLYAMFLAGVFALATGALPVVTAAPRDGAAPSITEQVLYSFCSQSNCADGANPFAYGGLIMDTSGNLYGTTSVGGNATGGGTVFQLTPSDTGWSETVLYSFCSQTNCADGASPLAGLIMDAAGNLYGTTSAGGTSAPGTGVVFQLTPDPTGTGWTETVLYSFCSQIYCADGYQPLGGLIMDGAGNLYGTTRQGDNNPGTCALAGSCGVVFELTPDPTGTVWTETVLYRFCSQLRCADGVYPYGGLIMDASGNLYGTTNGGGANDGSQVGPGVVFELTPDATGTAWTETVLHSFFCSNCADGANPAPGLIMDGAGNLYGTTTTGGATGGGTVFQLTPSDTGWSETVLYSFCSQTRCADGLYPYGDLIMDEAGNLYGTTWRGGSGTQLISGVAFELTPDSTGTAWTETVLYNFCSQSNCADGGGPFAGLLMDASGNLYGTTNVGGNFNNKCAVQGCGTVFALNLGTTLTASNRAAVRP